MEMNQHWTYLSKTMTLLYTAKTIFGAWIITVKLLWNNLYCKKRYINKGDFTDNLVTTEQGG